MTCPKTKAFFSSAESLIRTCKSAVAAAKLVESKAHEKIYTSVVKDGKISIDLKSNKEWLYIDFTDSGLGISRQNKARIFNPGFSTKKRGWGIGLNLSKRIINHLHGGKLFLHKSTTKETVFRVLLKFPTS